MREIFIKETETFKEFDIMLNEEKIGHAVGGVCPFGINENVEVYLDISLRDYEYVYPACGSSNSAIKLFILNTGIKATVKK